MRCKGLPAAILAVCLGIATQGIMASQAQAFGHGSSPSIDSFVRKETKINVFVAKAATNFTDVLARQSLGNNLELIVTKNPERAFWHLPIKQPSAKEHVIRYSWQPSDLISIIEWHPNANSDAKAILQNAKVIFHRPELNPNIYLVAIKAEQIKNITKNPLIYLHTISAVPNEEFNANYYDRHKIKPSGFFIKKENKGKNLVLKPSTEELVQTIRELSGEQPTSDGKGNTIPERGSKPSRTLAQDYVKSRFEEMGMEATLRCYRQSFYEGCNVEGTLWGEDRTTVTLITAHLDSVSNKGADDDASGVAAMLEVARLIKSVDYKTSYRFVGFDQEELGLIGSKAYAEQITSKVSANAEPVVKAVFQMDMIGFDSNNDGVIHAMDCGRANSTDLTKIIATTLQDLRLPLTVNNACTDRSDHASFWRKGIPATLVSENFFGGDANTCYHKKCDALDLINVDYMSNIVSLVANSAFRFAE